MRAINVDQEAPRHKDPTLPGFDRPVRSAALSECGLFRYTLEHRWGTGAAAVFVLCNPSTADATQDDPTSRKCDGFARRWGCGARVIVNVCALRARDPRALRKASDPFGPQNEAFWHKAFAETTGPLVVGWGAVLPERAHVGVRRLLAVAAHWRRVPLCLGMTDAGEPRHPLYVPYATKLEPYNRSGSHG